MTIRTRKFLGTIALLVLVVVWSLTGMAAAQMSMIANSGWLQAIFSFRPLAYIGVTYYLIVRQATRDETRPADVIVVFGAGVDGDGGRIEAANTTVRVGDQPTVLPAGTEIEGQAVADIDSGG